MSALLIRYQNVCIEALGYTLPDEVVSSAEIERRLGPLYRRLRLPEGRLELMTGIRERRFWPAATLPGDVSVETGRRTLAAAGFRPDHVGALIHGSVCRDRLEPATAAGVHDRLGLPSGCAVYDVSNACLGLLNGILQAANMIELGQIRSALVVGTENGRSLVENTIAALNSDLSLTRASVKPAVASLTIGSASAGVLLAHRDVSRTQSRLLGGAALAETAHHQLCQSGGGESVGDRMGMLMQTDSERLMREGVDAADKCFAQFTEHVGWGRRGVDKTVCHQVGLAHRKLLLDTLGLDAADDFTTVERLGNTGAAALPTTMAVAAESGHFAAGDQAALLGIGSGINVVMLGVDWRPVPVGGGAEATELLHRRDEADTAGEPHSPRMARLTMSRSK